MGTPLVSPTGPWILPEQGGHVPVQGLDLDHPARSIPAGTGSWTVSRRAQPYVRGHDAIKDALGGGLDHV
jgi:hypothetical protein